MLAEAKFKPANTLEFHFYSGTSKLRLNYLPIIIELVYLTLSVLLGEEGGLQGSRGVMQSYARSGVKVLAVMNQDVS